MTGDDMGAGHSNLLSDNNNLHDKQVRKITEVANFDFRDSDQEDCR